MAFSASSSPVSVSGRQWLFSTVIAGFCFWEVVAPSAPLAPAGFSSYPTSIYESEPLLLLCLSCFEKLVLNGFIPYPTTTSRLAVVSWILVPKEEGSKARAPRGSSGA
ncbi:hypothetical protein YC2023_016052 [Brassica napus]